MGGHFVLDKEGKIFEIYRLPYWGDCILVQG